MPSPPPGSTRIDPGVRPNGDVFFDDITRGYKQKAAFGEFSYDILPRQLTLSVGTRVYSIETYEVGSSNSGYGCRFVPAGQCQNGNNLNADHLDKTYGGHKDKFNLSWKIAEGVMLCATYSEGFRPGGFNRRQGAPSPSSPLYGTGFQSVYGNQIFTANGPDYRVRGLEGNVVFNATDHLSLMSSFAWDSSSQHTSVHLVTPNRPRTLGVRIGYRL